VPSSGSHTEVTYAVICDRASLIWAANLATLEFHVPLWRVGRRRKLPGPPDHVVFDLDPGEGTSIVECCEVADHLAGMLEDERLEGYPKTSGSKGLQVYAPLNGRPTWDTARELARRVAGQLAVLRPDLVVVNMRKALRQGKVLIDWSQNHPAKTTVAAYSLRGLPQPRASTPVTWDEVRNCRQSGDPADLCFTAPQVLERVERLGDLFGPVTPTRT
jgi:bifunctional non-homologous end joining protein LigD